MNSTEIEGLCSLSAEIAGEIVNSEIREIRFGALSSLSPKAAAILCQTKASIEFSHLESITIESAEALIPHTGMLKLPKLRELPPMLGFHLAKHVGPIDLSGLETISEEDAILLVTCSGKISLKSIKYLEFHVANRLADHDGNLELSGLTFLSSEIALALSRHRGYLDLSGITSITDDAARNLYKHGGVLKLNGLSTLSDAAAEFLSMHKGPLYLDGIHELSDASIEALINHDFYLSLNGIELLKSGQLAKFLNWNERTLSLKNIKNIKSEDIALLISIDEKKVLLGNDLITALGLVKQSESGHAEAQIRIGYLYEIGGLLMKDHEEALKNYKMAAEQHHPIAQYLLFRFSERYREPTEVKSLLRKALESIARHQGDLRINDFFDDDLVTKKTFSKVDSTLYLGCLSSITDVEFDALCSFEGKISLGGIVNLSEESASILARFRAELIFEVIVSISDYAAEALSQYDGEGISFLSLRSISDEQAEIFSRFSCKNISFHSLIDISDSAAEFLAKFKGSLIVFGQAKISKRGALSLSYSSNLYWPEGVVPERVIRIERCDMELFLRDPYAVNLECAKSISADAMKLLVNTVSSFKTEEEIMWHHFRPIVNGWAENFKPVWPPKFFESLENLEEDVATQLVRYPWQYFDFSNLMTIPDSVVGILAKMNRQLFLNGISQISSAGAKNLSGHIGFLSLNGLKTITTDVALYLSKHRGSISLNGLKFLNADQGGFLAKIQGGLYLNGIEKLTLDLANSLSNHKGEFIQLKGVSFLEDNVASQLSRYKGESLYVGFSCPTERAALTLASRRGKLCLYNVKILSDGAAEALGRHKGVLHIDGLEEISPRGAKALLRHNTKDGSLSGCIGFLRTRAGIKGDGGFFQNLLG